MYYYIWVMHCSWNLKKKKINKKIKKNLFPPQLKYYFIVFFFLIFYPTVQISHLYLSQLSPLSQPSPPSAHPEAQLSSVHPLDPCRHRPSSPVQLWPTPSVNPAHWPKPQAPSPTLSYIWPTLTPSSPPIFEAQLRSTIKLSMQSAIADPRRLLPITVFMCVCLCCCWAYFGVIQKILNFLKFCFLLVIFDDLSWEKRLRIWVGVMQPFCLVTEKTENILIIWLLIEIGFCWVKWY